MSKPSLVFAAGAWYPQTIFDPIIEKLADYRSHSVAFPSVHEASSVTDLQPDIDAVRSLVQREADDGNDIVVIAHSWAGLPVSSALDGLSKTEREQAGNTGGVVKLVFIAAFLPSIGESLIGAFGGMPPPWYELDVSCVFMFRSHCFAVQFPASKLAYIRRRKKKGLCSPVIHSCCSSTMFPMAKNGSNHSSPMLGSLKLRQLLVRHISISLPHISCASRIAQLPCQFSRSWSNVLDARVLRLRPRRLTVEIRHGWLCLISLSLTSKSMLRSESQHNSSTMRQTVLPLNDVNFPPQHKANK